MSAQQRIHLNPNAPRAPMGYTPDPTPSYRATPTSSNAQANDLLSQVHKWSSKAEDLIEAYTQVTTPFCLNLGSAHERSLFGRMFLLWRGS